METKTLEPISYSQIQSWLTCGEQYRLERIEKNPQVPAWWSIGGSAVHEASEKVDLLGLTDQVSISALFMETMDRLTAEAEKYNNTPRSEFRASRKQDYEWWKNNGVPMLMGWQQWTQKNPVAAWPGGKAVEIPVQGSLDGVPIRGYIDRICEVNGVSTVVDLKTGNNVPKSSIQLALYRVLLKEQYAVDTQGMGYFMARKGEYIAAPEPEPEAMALLTDYAKALVYAKQTNTYLPNPGILCGYCSVKDKCRAQSLLVSAPKPQPKSPKPKVSPVTRLTATT